MTYSIVANECIFVPCPCGGNFGQFPGGFCEDCGSQGEVAEDISDLMTLAHNLAIGAALCRAFDIGVNDGVYVGFHGRHWWRPGCGRQAP